MGETLATTGLAPTTGTRHATVEIASTSLGQHIEGHRSSHGSASRSSERSWEDSTPPSSPNGTSQSENSLLGEKSSASLATTKSSLSPATYVRDGLPSDRRAGKLRLEPIQSTSLPLPQPQPQPPAVRRRFGFPSLKLLRQNAPSQAHSLQLHAGPSPTKIHFSTEEEVAYITRNKKNSPEKIRQRSPTFPTIHNPATSTEESSIRFSLKRTRGASACAHPDAIMHPVPPIPLRPTKSIPNSTFGGDLRSQYHKSLLHKHQTGDCRGSRMEDYSMWPRHAQPQTDSFNKDRAHASVRSALTTSLSINRTNTSGVTSLSTPEGSMRDHLDSQVIEIAREDEGMTVEDAIAMYEAGFTDDLPSDAANVALIGPESPFLEIPRGEKTLSAPVLPRESRPSLPVVHKSTTILLGGPKLEPPVSPIVAVPRDQYGFRKVSQYVNLEQYDAWNLPYTQHLNRRKKKWQILIEESGQAPDDPVRFPQRSDKMKRYVRKGIPFEYRAAAWWWYAGGQSRMQKHPGLYQRLVREAVRGQMNDSDRELIERDLNRTFPDNSRFKPDSATSVDVENERRGVTSSSSIEPETPILQALRRVLQTFSIQNPKIGYCQSLNFLAGLLLLFMEEEKAFWMLNIITQVYLPGTHELNLEGANVDLGVLMTSIKESMPAVWAKVGGELDGSAGDGRMSTRLPPISLCATAWFMSCFIGTLPIETVLRVWDCFFYEGSKTIFRIALAIFKVGEAEILAVNDPMEIFQVVQTIPRRLLDANALMEACFKRRNGFGHLSQETIDEARRHWRKLYAQERARVAVGAAPGLERGGSGMKSLLRRADSKRRLRKAQLID